jgi:hypothetical protein
MTIRLLREVTRGAVPVVDVTIGEHDGGPFCFTDSNWSMPHADTANVGPPVSSRVLAAGLNGSVEVK